MHSNRKFAVMRNAKRQLKRGNPTVDRLHVQAFTPTIIQLQEKVMNFAFSTTSLVMPRPSNRHIHETCSYQVFGKPHVPTNPNGGGGTPNPNGGVGRSQSRGGGAKPHVETKPSSQPSKRCTIRTDLSKHF